MEITFDNGFVARYGEISNRVPNGISLGAHVAAGNEIGYIMKNNHNGLSMLHLELYSGTLSGPLTVKSRGGFQRRSDLIDPTPILDHAMVQ